MESGTHGTIVTILLLVAVIVLYRLERVLVGITAVMPEVETTLNGINSIIPDIKYIVDSAKRDMQTVNEVQTKATDVLDFL